MEKMTAANLDINSEKFGNQVVEVLSKSLQTFVTTSMAQMDRGSTTLSWNEIK